MCDVKPQISRNTKIHLKKCIFVQVIFLNRDYTLCTSKYFARDGQRAVKMDYKGNVFIVIWNIKILDVFEIPVRWKRAGNHIGIWCVMYYTHAKIHSYIIRLNDYQLFDTWKAFFVPHHLTTFLSGQLIKLK